MNLLEWSIKVYTIFWLVEKYNNASKYLKFDVPNAKEFNENKLLNIVEELKKYKTFLKEYDLIILLEWIRYL